MLRPITVIQKNDRFKIGYKPNSQGKKKLMEEKRGKRIASYSFHSAGFINFGSNQDGEKSMIQELDVNEAFESLTIDMIGAESETSNTRLPPFPRG